LKKRSLEPTSTKSVGLTRNQGDRPKIMPDKTFGVAVVTGGVLVYLHYFIPDLVPLGFIWIGLCWLMFLSTAD
jgi:hypothetical protein